MLHIIIGRAGSGKTAAIMEEIHRLVEAQVPGTWMLVPEQFSHEAERELCAFCGDSLSRYAEVLSFTGLARLADDRLGGEQKTMLDRAGRMLCMNLALEAVRSRLRIYKNARSDPDQQGRLLAAVEELKTAGIRASRMEEAAARCGDTLRDKLKDMSLILEAYDAIVANGYADPADRLTRLAEQLPRLNLTEQTHVYVDGFTDFTGQQQEILRRLLSLGVQLTVCLTTDGSGDEVFSLADASLGQLKQMAEDTGNRWEIRKLAAGSRVSPVLQAYQDGMFRYDARKVEDPEETIRLFRAVSPAEECEFAAGRVLELVREKGCRYRDIAIAVRGFESYRIGLESMFEHYGVPLYVSERTGLLTKPVPSMLELAYRILADGWNPDDVISYLHTGLTGLTREECDRLENYVFLWQLKAPAWKRKEDWKQHPDGFNGKQSEESRTTLAEINRLRRQVAEPLLNLERRGKAARTAMEQARALTEYMTELNLAQRLEERAKEQENCGEGQEAEVTLQVWDTVVRAIGQSAAILSDCAMGMQEYGRLFTALLSCYDIGTIPVSLDRVIAGDFDRMRRRSIRHLIVLGAEDTRIPAQNTRTDVFTESDRLEMQQLQLEIGGCGDGEAWREFALVYNCLTLPSDTLTMTCPLADSEGSEARPSLVFETARRLTGREPDPVNIRRVRLNAPAPALTLAAQSLHDASSREAQAAGTVFRQLDPERFRQLEQASVLRRGNLSRQTASMLYGKYCGISPSRTDRFYQCRYGYFLQYGLQARAYKPASFNQPEYGSFMHYVLKGTAEEVKKRGGFALTAEEEVDAIARQMVEQYVTEEMQGLEEKSPRFVYLFRRLEEDVCSAVRDMAAELRNSDFEPLELEFDFTREGIVSPIDDGAGGKMRISGIADRIDGWEHDGKLYLRIGDYKTGVKKFNLSDVWYGSNLQMLLYLFTLEKNGKNRFGGREIVPAGVMYIPARDEQVSMKGGEVSREDAERERDKKLRRSGLILDDPELQAAWDRSEGRKYIPIEVKRGKPSEDAIASAERLGLLARHVERRLSRMANQLRQGCIGANPDYVSENKNACTWCDYRDACHFGEGYGDEKICYHPSLKAETAWRKMEQEDSEEQPEEGANHG